MNCLKQAFALVIVTSVSQKKNGTSLVFPLGCIVTPIPTGRVSHVSVIRMTTCWTMAPDVPPGHHPFYGGSNLNAFPKMHAIGEATGIKLPDFLGENGATVFINSLAKYPYGIPILARGK